MKDHRTVSYKAALILAGVPPAELVADALVESYAKVKVIRLEGGQITARIRENIRLRGRRRVFEELRQRLEQHPPTTGVRAVEAILPCRMGGQGMERSVVPSDTGVHRAWLLR